VRAGVEVRVAGGRRGIGVLGHGWPFWPLLVLAQCVARPADLGLFVVAHLQGFDVGGVGGDDDGDDGAFVLGMWVSSDSVGGWNGVTLNAGDHAYAALYNRSV
jgi:hypothetical protein